MKQYMVITENPIAESVEAEFFYNIDEAMHFAESSRYAGYYAEVYQRICKRFEGRIVGFEYRRVD